MARQTISGLFFLFFCSVGHAYPNFISYGYQSCLSCHYNPAGGGPLTDYGRVVAATLISDQVFWMDGKTDEQLEGQSSFFFSKPNDSWYRPQIDFRELFMRSDVGHPDQKSQFITMEATAAIVAKFLNDDRLTLVADIGYAPTPTEAQGTGQKYQNYRSRELYAGYRLSKEIGVYAGLMDKVFGIRVPDHEAFSRSNTNLNQDDQTYGVLVNWLSGKWEIDVQPFAGNLVQESDLRQKGATTMIGYAVSETARLEASILRSTSSYLDMLMYSVDARVGAGKGHSLMLEVGQVQRSQRGLSPSTGRYVFMQDHLLVKHGLYTLLTMEMSQGDVDESNEFFRFGPGLQYFVNQRFEWRTDIYDLRTYQTSNYAPDNWTITAQLHLWF